MPRYDFRCPAGHVSEHVCSMAEIPTTIACKHVERLTSVDAARLPREEIDAFFGAADARGGAAPHVMDDSYAYVCGLEAERMFCSPAAIIFKGTGFYATDVKGRVERRRRKGAADLMPAVHDAGAEAIARHI